MEIQPFQTSIQSFETLNASKRFIAGKVKVYDEVNKGFTSKSPSISFRKTMAQITDDTGVTSSTPYGMNVYKNYLSHYLKNAENMSENYRSAERAQSRKVQELEMEINQYESPFAQEFRSDIFTFRSKDNPIISSFEDIKEKIQLENKNRTLLAEKLKAYRIAREAGRVERSAMTAENTIRLVA